MLFVLEEITLVVALSYLYLKSSFSFIWSLRLSNLQRKKLNPDRQLKSISYWFAAPPLEKVFEDKFLPQTILEIAPIVDKAFDIVEFSFFFAPSF